MHNRGKTDYTVINLEYAVSSTSSFFYYGKSKKEVPRFDIIAVDKSGKFLLFCHEVRVGSCADGGKYVLLFY